MMEKRLLFIFAVCLIPFSGFSQTHVEILNSLDLPVYTFNQKPAKNEKITKSASYPDMSSSEKPLLKNKLFSKVTLYYDELNELNIIVYDVVSQSKFKSNKKKLLGSFKKICSSEKNRTDESGIFYIFTSGENEITLFEPNESYKILEPYLKIRPRNNVKVNVKYDELNKTTSIYPINFNEWINQEDLKYAITFIGYKESKKLCMRILSQSENSRFSDKIQILTETGESYDADLSTSKNVIDKGTMGFVTQEVGVVELSKEWVGKILNSKTIKIRIQGKKTGDLILSNDIINALKVVSAKLYQ
jgi:hypothetical protein